MKYDKYISTTLPYANSVPHIGHALEFIQADALVKYFRNGNETVFFNTGVDENGLKVYTKAQELGIDTQKYLDELVIKWLRFCQDFEIYSDNFYRTTRLVHHSCVTQFWYKCLERGDLYKKSYVGHYCTGCESFKTETDLVDGKCPDHGTEPTEISEENWFFRTTKYKDRLLAWLDSSTDFLHPSTKVQELRNIILTSEDVSVSRLKRNVPWGVDVPNDPDQVIYVWFEALLNYIFAVPNFQSQHFIQICGPDNIRFQGLLFQAMIESEGLPHTKNLLVHGTVLGPDGSKMSKSKGNVVDPMDQLTKYGLDAVRYYTLAGLSTFGNSTWSEYYLVAAYNTELADDFGNLIARVLHLIDTKGIDIKKSNCYFPYLTDLSVKVYDINKLWESFNIHQALKETNQLVKDANKYINDKKPWSDDPDATIVLNNLYATLKAATDLYKPVLSTRTILSINDALTAKKKSIIFKKLDVSLITKA